MIKSQYTNKPLDTEKCVENVGNRFDLVLIASARARELRRGHQKMVSTVNSIPITALREVEEGYVGREYLKKVR
jgi:DNA-directed RNA polymerase subunit omega